MNTETETEDSAEEPTFAGKIVGVAEDRQQLLRITDAISAPDPDEMSIMDGPEGIVQLKNWREIVSHYFMSDMEGEMVDRFLEAARDGKIVFAVAVDPADADETALSIKQAGATDVAHFGNSATTGY